MADVLASSPRRILLVAPSSPCPADWGGAQRTALLMEALGSLGEVDLLVLDDAIGRRSWMRRLGSGLLAVMAPGVAAARFDRVRAAVVDRHLAPGRHDLVVIRYSATACQLGDLGRRHPGVTVLVDVDDSLAQLFERGRSGPLARWVSSRERRILVAADGLWRAGPLPAWASASDAPPMVELPNIPFNASTGPQQGDPSAPPVFLGVAQFRYRPNREGFDWFARRVWPIIRRARPDARLRLVGLPPPAALARRWRATPGVELTGRVEAVAPCYADATVAIAPIHRGGGTKIKVVEALAMAVPCVCSPHAALGLEALTSLFIASDAASFAAECLALAEDAPRRARLVEIGRRDVDAHFSRHVFAERVERLVEAAANRRAATGRNFVP